MPLPRPLGRHSASIAARLHVRSTVQRLLLPALAALLALISVAACAPKAPAPPPPAAPVAPAPRKSSAILGQLHGPDGRLLTSHDIRNTPPFSTAYRALLRRNQLKDMWLVRFDGPRTPVLRLLLEGTEYIRAEGCGASGCAVSHVLVLYSEKERLTYARVTQHGQPRWIGDPPPELLEALERVERSEGR